MSETAAATPLARPGRPRVVFFYEERSGRSRRTDGFLAQVLQRRRNHETFIVHRVERVQRPDLARRFRVETVPTLIVIAEGKVQGRLEDPSGCQEIELLLGPWLR
jgi:thioredoxin-like negative regulator of GroEL